MHNVEVDLLIKLALIPSLELSRMIHIEYLEAPSIYDKKLLSIIAKQDDSWRGLIIWYLKNKEKPTYKADIQKLNCIVFYYLLINNILNKWEHSLPLLKYLDS